MKSTWKKDQNEEHEEKKMNMKKIPKQIITLQSSEVKFLSSK